MKHKIRKRHLKLWVKCIIVLILFLIAFLILNTYLTPIITASVKSKSMNIINEAVNLSVYEELEKLELNYDDLIHIERSSANEVLSVQADSVKINKLKALISSNIQNRILNNNSGYSVSIGTLLGSSILMGRGFSVNFNIVFLSASFNEIKSSFVSAGINQTKHSVYFEIITKIKVMLPNYDEYIDISSNVCIAETVIVGKVPNVYAVTDNNNLNVTDLAKLNDMSE